MNKRTTSWATLAAGIFVTGLMNVSTEAQSVDSLLDKLVDKGVLSVNEAKELREEADKDFNKAYQVKTGVPNWVTSLKFGGDFRGRYEGFYLPESVDRNRFRYRLRFGTIATIKDDFEVGLRLSSSEPAGPGTGNGAGDPVSGNTTLSDNASRKWIYVDLAYAKWTGLKFDNFTGSLAFGKVESPFVYSSMLFDADYNPEGFAGQLNYQVNDNHTLRLVGGGFSVREIGSSSYDSYLLGSQLRIDSKWTPRIATTAGIGIATVTTPGNLSTGSIPNQNRGNTRVPVGSDFKPAYNFNPFFADAAASYTLESFPGYKAAFPIKFFGEYMENPAAPDDNKAYQVGVGFGKAGKKGLWEINYAWRYQEADSWFEEFVESDFGAFYPTAPNYGGTGYGSGTNVKGHIVKGSYSLFDSLTLSVSWFHTKLIDQTASGAAPSVKDTSVDRLQVDASWKF